MAKRKRVSFANDIELNVPQNDLTFSKAPTSEFKTKKLVLQNTNEKEVLVYDIKKQFQIGKELSISQANRGSSQKLSFNEMKYMFVPNDEINEAYKAWVQNPAKADLPKRQQRGVLAPNEVYKFKSGLKTYYNALKPLWRYLDVRGLYMDMICLLKYLPNSGYPVINPIIIQEFCSFMINTGFETNQPHVYIQDIIVMGKTIHKKGEHIIDKYGAKMHNQASWNSIINIRNLKSAITAQLYCGGLKESKFEVIKCIKTGDEFYLGNPLKYPYLDDYLSGIMGNLGKKNGLLYAQYFESTN